MGCVHSSKAERPKPHQQQGLPPNKSRQNRYNSHPPTTQSGDRQLVSGGRQLSGSTAASKGGRHRPPHQQQQPPVQIQSIDKKESAQPVSVHLGVKRSDSTSPTRDSGEMPI